MGNNMAKPIQHDTGDVMEGAAMGAVQGAAGGFIASAIGGAAVVAGLMVLGIAVAASIGTGGVAAIPAAIVASAGYITGFSIIGGIASAATIGTVSAGVGALLGTVRSANKMSREQSAYVAKTRAVSGDREAEMAAVHNQAMQMGFQAGVEQGRAAGQQEGAQMVVAKLQEHEAHHAEKTHSHEHAHHDEASKKSFAAAETQRRENAAAAAAAAGAQIG
jgi:hypothetical protein